ncbi:FAD-binding protein [Streptomyces lydicus]|nr:FAD-binding protein [Streptomyces lydicus]
MRAALHASGLRAYWLRQYPWLREPGSLAAAEAHVLGTLATLPKPYRAGYAAALRLLPLAFRVAAGRSLRRASAEEGRRGMRSLAALPASPRSSGPAPRWLCWARSTDGRTRRGEVTRMLTGERGRTVETDVLVIGSGAGGSVAALELAAAGRQVTVLEEGPGSARPTSLRPARPTTCAASTATGA